MTRLYKSKRGAKFCGVCAGIANYFKVDPTIVRLIWIVFMIVGGSGFLAYIICAAIMPNEPVAPEYYEKKTEDTIDYRN